MKTKRIFLAVVVGLLIFSIYFNKKISAPNENFFGDKVFKIEKGDGIKKIADNLHEQGFLDSVFWFKVYVGASGNKNKFYDGEYGLRTDFSIKDLVKTLVTKSANNRGEVDITLLEGWSIADYDNYLAEKNILKKGEFFDFAEKFDGLQYDFLFNRPKNADLEGFLYPDTYRIYENSTAEDIGKKMLENFGNKLTSELREEIKKQKKSIFEVITLASIVEKEMFGYENRQIVADVFLKRLKVGMALQSDATINFITQKGIAAPSYTDLQVKSAYNTYKNKGLTPGPICNPSIEAIKAVVYPAKTDYWYFLTTKDGQIIFSRTHDEHVANKYKYLK
ncbi:MAG: endolytic transglycosylase MltG [Patescibacteria group bacterium]